VNYDVLSRTNRKMCLCTAMIYDPAVEEKNKTKKPTLAERWQQFKQFVVKRREVKAQELNKEVIVEE
jgi:hypothetical protein